MRKTKHRFVFPAEVILICSTIAEAGEKAYIVGGAIRDIIMGRPTEDFDLATTASPEKMIHLFKRVVPTGLKHGTVTVLLGNLQFEVTTLRGEGPYTDGRHPDKVAFISDINEDLSRRDFTINAMAWDPIRETLFDPFDGRDDVKARVLRAVGDPQERFKEDGLRVLRAARFVATLGFDVEKKTLNAMASEASALGHVSAERKRDELKKLLGATKPSGGLEVMAGAGLLPFVGTEFAELATCKQMHGIWSRTLARVDALPNTLHLRLAALLLDIGRINASDETEKPSQRAGKWLMDMRFEKKIVSSVSHLVGESRFQYVRELTDADIRRFMRRIGRGAVQDFLALTRADLVTKDGSEAAGKLIDELALRVRSIEQSGAALSARELDINGRELIQTLALTPGPKIGQLLEALVEHVIEHPEDNQKDRLIEQAKQTIL